jgi:hypothetical protein
MIDRREILEAASSFSLLPNIVEKDYVLGWMLPGIRYSRAEPVLRSAISKLIGFQKISILPCAMKNTSTRNSCRRLSKKSSPG